MSNLINISEAASLALHGLVLIAKNQPLRMNVKVLAEELNASQTHLAKVFQKLSKAGLVKSLRGPAGGFELSISNLNDAGGVSVRRGGRQVPQPVSRSGICGINWG